MAENEQYSSMEKEQLISLIYSLVKRDEERVQENQELKDIKANVNFRVPA